jgi:cytoskeletal protein CcmA (bactofilin family)
VFGDIHSDKHVELASKAEVAGDVYYNLIEMVMGSRVDGNLVHVRDGKDRTSTDATEVSTRDGKEKDARDERSSRPQSQPSAQVTSVKSKQA